MSRLTLAVVLWLSLLASARSLSAATESADARANSQDSTDGVDTLELIKQLGHDRYAIRRRAEDQLMRLGPEAFEDLRKAEGSSDLEIAERAGYILLRMRVDWVRPEDSPEVRRALTRFGDLSRNDKEKRIERLAILKNSAGVPGLCRIARLDTSPIIARMAALAVLKNESPGGERRDLAAACAAELGASQRPPVLWLHLWLGEAEDRRAMLADWHAAIQAEAALLDADSAETDAGLVYALMTRHLEACHEFGSADQTTATLLRIVDLWTDGETASRRVNNLAWALHWIIERQRWDVLEQFVDDRREELRSDRKLLYYVAAATSRSGKAEEAEKLADTAFAMGAGDADERVDTANAIVSLGFIDWGEREYRRALEDLPVVSWDSLRARREWSTWLHDREQYAKAAAVLDEFFQAYKEDRALRQQLMQQLDGREYIDSLSARAEFYRACEFATHKKYDDERAALEKAWRLYDEDPDILIAMYRSEGADPAYRAQTVQRIQEMSQKHIALIEQFPEEPRFHNQWAWLISNTVGDYEKAVEHSKKSLELSPEEPSYLDTLGRCYYAAGDLENAVKVQRRAVELSPHYQVMRRQLALFEQELAAIKE